MLAGILKPVVRKRGLAGADLVMAWRDIAGPQFADCTMPDRIAWPKTTAFDDRNGAAPGTLIVRCAGPAAVLLQHDLPQIVERINSFLGWYAVERIKIVQGTVHVSGRKTPPVLPELSQQELTEVRERVAGVRDDRLREALATLGTSVLASTAAARKRG